MGIKLALPWIVLGKTNRGPDTISITSLKEVTEILESIGDDMAAIERFRTNPRYKSREDQTEQILRLEKNIEQSLQRLYQQYGVEVWKE